MGKDLEDQMKLFWMIYAFDKNISLKSGRPPHIPDNDVDARLPAITADPKLRAWDEASLAYIRLAQIQGRIYDDLYCASALRRSEADRQASIKELNSRLRQWKEDFSAIDPAGACHYHHFEFTHGSSDTIVESLCTIVHRASSVGPRRFVVSADCLRAATDCLAAHVRYISRYSGYTAGVLDGYVNGVLSWASLTPFVVVFMHAIVNRSPDGVVCLQQTTAAIGSIATLSITCKRLHKLCSTFANFAAAVVQAEQTTYLPRTRHHNEAIAQQPLAPWRNSAHPNQHQENESSAASTLDSYQTTQQVGGLSVPAPEADTYTSTSYYDQYINLMPDRFMHWVESNRPVFNFDFGAADAELNYEYVPSLPTSGGATRAQ